MSIERFTLTSQTLRKLGHISIFQYLLLISDDMYENDCEVSVLGVHLVLSPITVRQSLS